MKNNQLIYQILKNNNPAFQSLIKKHIKFVYTTIFNIIENHHNTKDIFKTYKIDVTFTTVFFLKILHLADFEQN